MKWVIALSILCLSCTLLERRNVSKHEPWQDYIHYQDQEVTTQARRELGYLDKHSLNEQEEAKLYWRKELIKAENTLNSPSEIRQYYDYKAYFVNDRQRLHFLKIQGLEAKQAWLDKYIPTGSAAYSSEVKEAIKKQDIIPYMTKEAVRESWGRPDNVEISGRSVYNNERWTYTSYVSTADGDMEERKYLYFENGQLIAWETANH